ncbi:MAG: polysaccharide export protein [Polyangiaceae bacterium]|nr:polysaccharide export protein [Polyangiaceae bacterium]
MMWRSGATNDPVVAEVSVRSASVAGASGERRARALGALLAAMVALASACGPAATNQHVELPAPIESTSLGPGDVFQMQIVSEKDLPQQYQIASDGTVDLPYIHRQKVVGLEPQEVQELVTRELIAKQILTNPSVIISVQEYNSKKVTVLGQVQKPGAFSFASGMTLIQAISLAGGLNSIAHHDRVNLTRKLKQGAKTVVVSVDAITEGRSPDIPLQAGDQIYVHERIF